MSDLIMVPTTSVPVVDSVSADGQFTDQQGNSIPYINPDGAVSATTTDHIVAGKTTKVATSAVGLQVGDWVVATNGGQTDDPRQILMAGSWGIVVAEPFGIDATGTTTLTKSRVTPQCAWSLHGHAFGYLRWDAQDQAVVGEVEVDSNVRPRRGVITIELHVGSDGKHGAVKTQKVEFPTGGKCKAALAGTASVVTFGLSGPLQGKDVYIRAYAFMGYEKVCNIRPGTVQLGPRVGPVFTVPS